MAAQPNWRRSTYCGNAACVEVATLYDGVVAVRDNKDLGQAPIGFTTQAWLNFTTALKLGDFSSQS